MAGTGRRGSVMPDANAGTDGGKVSRRTLFKGAAATSLAAGIAVGSADAADAADAALATDVDQGRLGWDQRLVDAWPGFRAPTNELTATLIVRELLGMATGIVEPAALES